MGAADSQPSTDVSGSAAAAPTTTTATVIPAASAIAEASEASRSWLAAVNASGGRGLAMFAALTGGGGSNVTTTPNASVSSGSGSGSADAAEGGRVSELGSFMTVDRDLNLLEIAIPDRRTYARDALTPLAYTTYERGAYICNLVPHRLAPDLFIQKNAVNAFDIPSVGAVVAHAASAGILGGGEYGAGARDYGGAHMAARDTFETRPATEWPVIDKVVHPLTHASHAIHSMFCHVTSDARTVVPFQLHAECRCLDSASAAACPERVLTFDTVTGQCAPHPDLHLMLAQIPIHLGDAAGPFAFAGPVVRFAQLFTALRESMPPPLTANSALCVLLNEYLGLASPFVFLGRTLPTPLPPGAAAPQPSTALLNSSPAKPRASFATAALEQKQIEAEEAANAAAATTPTNANTTTSAFGAPAGGAAAVPMSPALTRCFDADTLQPLGAAWHPLVPVPTISPTRCFSGGAMCCVDRGARFLATTRPGDSVFDPYHVVVTELRTCLAREFDVLPSASDDRDRRQRAVGFWFSADSRTFYYVTAKAGSRGVATEIVAVDTTLWTTQTLPHPDAEPSPAATLAAAEAVVNAAAAAAAGTPAATAAPSTPTGANGRRKSMHVTATGEGTADAAAAAAPAAKGSVAAAAGGARRKSFHVTAATEEPTSPAVGLKAPPIFPPPPWIEANPRPTGVGTECTDDWVDVSGPGAVRIGPVAPDPPAGKRGSVFEYTPLTEHEYAAREVIATVRRVEAAHYAPGSVHVRPDKFPPTLTPRLTLMCFDRLCVKACAPGGRYFVKFGVSTESDWYALVDAQHNAIVQLHPFWRTLKSGGKGEFQYHLMRAWYMPPPHEPSHLLLRGAIAARLQNLSALHPRPVQCINNRMC